MQNGNSIPLAGPERIELARKCLTLISNIAQRGATSESPAQIGYALQELTQVLLERTGRQERLFEPVAADQIPDLSWLNSELELVDGFSQDMRV